MKIMKVFAALALVLLMGACGGGDKAGKVNEAIQSGAQLSEQDYSVMIDYCGEYAEKAQEMQDKINTLAPESQEAVSLLGDLASLSGKYPYLKVFSDKISSATQAEVGEENVAKINKLAYLTWFASPEWADVAQNADVEGSIVDMPQADSAGVIAGGDGEAVAE